MSLILVKTVPNGTVTQIALPSAQTISVEANAHYTVIDSVTGQAPALDVLKVDNNLVLQEVSGAETTAATSQPLIEIEQFFVEGADASFAADGSALAQATEASLITSSTPASAFVTADGSALVWQASSSFAASSAAASSSVLLYSLAGGAAVLGGVALASSSDDSSNSTPDTVSPSVVITDDTTGTAIGDVTYTFTFSEEVAGFTVDDIVITGGTAGILSTSDNIIYTLVVTPNSDSTTDITVDVAADVATNLAGNGNTAAITNTQTVDTVSPSVVITGDTTGTAIGDVTYTFTFSEEVTGFTVDDIVITGGTAGTLSTSDNITYTLVVTPPDDSTTAITVDVAADVATDIEGNGNIIATTNTQAVDTELPIATITSSDTDITNTESVSVQSSDLGTAYLVHSSVTVTDIASITDADDSLWNSVEITSIDTDTNLSAVGLSGGEYTLYTTDAAGNLGEDTNNPVSITDTSVVAFYFNERESSDHSGRTFDADVSYTIYFIIEELNSDSTYYNINDDSIWLWNGADALGEDDTIIFVGTDGVAGFDSGRDFTRINSNNSGITIRDDLSSGLTARLILRPAGALTTFTNSALISSGNVWRGSWSAINGSLGSALPSGVLTSQGLA